MEKLITLTNVTKKILEEHPETRSDDGKLVIEVFKVLKINPRLSLSDIVSGGYFPFISSILRIRRKLQREIVELTDELTEKRRTHREKTFRAFARSYVKDLLSEGETK